MDFETPIPSYGAFGLEEMGTQKISVVSDQSNGFHYKNENSDRFVLDIESLSHAAEKDSTPNSRITLQKNLSRKGFQRGGEKKINEKETVVATSSPRAALSLPGSPMAVAVGTTDHLSSNPPQAHHQITITAGNIGTIAESKWGTRRYSFRRSPQSSWTIDPRKILFFFATLSSMGTILLIYFTLSMSKFNGDDSDTLDWPH